MIRGYGLHTGVLSDVHFHRVEGGVRFLRNGVEIPARVESVIATPRCTILGKNHEKIALVEHILAALHVTGWWQGLLIEVSNEEIPILDGSAQGWLKAIAALGTPPQQERVWRVKQAYSSGEHEKGSFLAVSPTGIAQLSVAISYDHPAIGAQRWLGTPSRYPELSAARTFGFLRDYEMLRSKGLASHASLENAIVFDDNGPLAPLRFPDELVRHKALDVLGDFFLLGRPLLGGLEVHKGSHTEHVAFMRQLFAHDVLEEVAL
ncbi:MAG: UDP-3-O-acyl-N-acetylglucosamine deacetylase [Trueperaceae bacterium]